MSEGEVGAGRVLVIDDDEGHAEALADALEMDGYTCEVVHTGTAGVEALRDRSFDAVLTDLVMHDRSGLEVLKDAKDSGRNGWPWVIAALIVGAFSPLIYMVVHRRWPASPGPDSQPGNATTRRSVAAFGLLALGGLTCAALMADGTDIAATVTASWSNFQIWLDLVIVMVLWLGWMFVDARRSGINPWGWLVFGLLLGSFAPLLYTVMHNRWPASHPPEG